MHSTMKMMAAAILLFAMIGSATEAQLHSNRIDSPLRLDGILDEPAWTGAEVISDFTQFELIEGAPPTERTEVRILHDSENLYIGFVCFDSEPGQVIHRELQWDCDILNDDMVAVVIDTYHDLRMGYYFGTNPNGAQYDGTFTSGSNGINRDWDGIWDVRSRMTVTGWTSEIRIPFKTLRFPEGDNQEWGINFKRIIRRKNEEVLWRGWSRNDGILELSKVGTLSIESALEKNLQFEVKPYILTGREDTDSSRPDNTLKYGVDLRYGISSNTTLDLTTKTDFAQIESDKEIINLTRFDVSYPEKRDFFLEGAENFDFTQGPIKLFYSRQIGISSEHELLPILGGAKLTRKSGDYRLGVMSVQTEEAGGQPSTNYSVFRMRKDVLEQSYIGFIATSLAENTGHDNQTYGIDAVYRTDRFLTDRNLDIQAYATGTVTDGRSKDSMAGRLYVNYPNDRFSGFLLYHARDEQFNPELGFYNRRGIQQYMAVSQYTPRPSIPYIKKFDFQPFYLNYYTDMGTKLISRQVLYRPFGVITNSNDRVEFNIEDRYEYYFDFHRLFKNVYIPRGSYQWWEYEVEIESSPQRTVAVDASTRWGGFYSGNKKTYSLDCTLKTSMYYSLSADVTYNKITLYGRRFDTREYGARAVVDFSTRLSSSTFVQYNNDTNEVNVNFRIHYIPRAGSDLYIVYNRLMDEEREYDIAEHAAMLKVNYAYRF